jgi:hypothetical protein
MSDDINAEELVKNIETFGTAEGDTTVAKTEAVESDVSSEKTPEVSALQFKTMEDLLKHKLEYTADGGKKINEDLQTILRRASQGYHYAQRLNEVNTREADWKEKLQKAEELNGKWSRFDEYAQKNPEWYTHWEQAWLNRGQNPNEAQEHAGGIDESRINALLEERLKPFSQYMTEIEQQKVAQSRNDEDRALEEQVKSIRTKYSDIDFDATDPESGKSLEYKVLEFGVQNGIKSFDTAFKAFYHDQLVKREVERSKANASTERQENAKAGIIERRSTPSKSGPTPNLKSMSWDQATEFAAKSLGIN